jgi:Ran GTPase-activating protein (RanGAP) involved in mRNA processing and transport
MTPAVANYLIDSLHVNSYISEINLHGNQLNDESARQLANLLEQNQVLYKIDISSNPIS